MFSLVIKPELLSAKSDLGPSPSSRSVTCSCIQYSLYYSCEHSRGRANCTDFPLPQKPPQLLRERNDINSL